MNSNPEVKVKAGKEIYKLHGRTALAFLLWWRTMTPEKPRVEFYKAPVGQAGHTFEPLHQGARGALARSQLVVSTNVPD